VPPTENGRTRSRLPVAAKSDEIIGLTDRGITLATGERRPVGMVVNASFKLPTVRLNDQEVAWPLEVGDDLGVKGHASVWAPTTGGTLRRFDTTADLVAVGNAIGYNAWARSQNYRSRRFTPHRRFLRPYNMADVRCVAWAE
jgi:hypothetical protein